MSRITAETNALGTWGYNYVDDVSGSSKGTLRLSSINYPNSQTTNFSYFGNTGDQRLMQISNLDPSSNVLSQFSYQYDPSGQITRWAQQQKNSHLNYNLGYDLAGQLVSADAGIGASSVASQFNYGYDCASNRNAVQQTLIQNATIGGTATPTDVVTLTVKDPALSGGQESVSYTVAALDTTSSIANQLAAAVSADSALQTLGVNASASSSKITLKSVSPNITTYSASASGAATETVSIGLNKSIENVTVGGTAHTGDTLTLTFQDPAISGNPVSKSYVVLVTDTLTSIATAMTALINTDVNLTAAGITATSANQVIAIQSLSPNVTGYSTSVSGTGATTTLASGLSLNGSASGLISGTVTAGDLVKVNVMDAGLSGGSETASYTVLSGDSLTSITTGIASAINADNNLKAIGVTASSSGTKLTVASVSTNPTTYLPFTSNSGATATGTEKILWNLPANGTQTAAVGGSKTTGDTIYINVYDSGLSGGKETVSYSVLSGDTLTSIASGIASAINADSNLSVIGVTAAAVSTVVNITSASTHATSYTSSLSSGATESIALGTNVGITQSAFNCLNELTGISSGGAVNFQASTTYPVQGAAVNVAQTVTVGGTVTAGDVLWISVHDKALSQAENIKYVVQSGDSTTSIATSFKNAINADSVLSNLGVTATSSGAVVSLTSNSTNATAYTVTVNSGGTESLALAGGKGAAGTITPANSFTANPQLLSGNNTATVSGLTGGGTNTTVTLPVSLNNPSSQSFTSDLNGNQISDGTNTYDWDCENRMIKVTYPSGTPSVSSTITASTNPKAAAITSTGTGKAYVCNYGNSSVSIFNTTNGASAGSITVGTTPSAVAFTPNGNTAYVANSGSGTVSVINTATSAVSTTVTVGTSPDALAITPDGSKVYVCNKGSDSVSVIATSTNTVSTTISLTAGAHPDSIAITPDGTAAYVTNNGLGNVSVINTSTNTVSTTVTVGTNPDAVAITPDGTQALVCNNGSGSVSVISTSSNTVVSTISLGSGTQPVGVAIAPNGTNRAFVCNYGNATVSVINMVNDQAIASIPVGTRPDGISITPDGSQVLVCNSSAGTVSVIDAFNNTVTSTLTAGPEPAAVACMFDSSIKAYVANNGAGTVSVINTGTNAVLATVTVGANPASVAITPDASQVYVANNGSANVSVINTASNLVTNTVSMGAGSNPIAVAITPDGTQAYVANNGTGNVEVISTASNSVTNTITVGTSPDAVAISRGGYAYVVNNGSGTVTPINTSTNTAGTAITVGSSPNSIAISPDQSKAYVCNGTSGSVSVINTGTDTVSSTITVGTTPAAVAFSPDGSKAFVANSGAGTCSVINVASGSVVATVTVGSSPEAVAVPEGGLAYVANNGSGSVSVINSSNSVATTLTMGTSPVALVATPDSTQVYCLNSGSGNVSAIGTSQNQSQYSYDGYGRRVKIVKLTNGSVASTKQFVFDGLKIAEERDASGSLVSQFFPRGQKTSGASYYYVFDHLGNIVGVVNSSGVLVTSISYDAFGRATVTFLSGNFMPDFTYAHMYLDQPSGLNLTWARAYSSQLGRWISRDPIGEDGGLNLFAYVGGNPVSFVDPFGLERYIPQPYAGGPPSSNFPQIRDVDQNLSALNPNTTNAPAGIPVVSGHSAPGVPMTDSQGKTILNSLYKEYKDSGSKLIVVKGCNSGTDLGPANPSAATRVSQGVHVSTIGYEGLINNGDPNGMYRYGDRPTAVLRNSQGDIVKRYSTPMTPSDWEEAQTFSEVWP